MIRFREAEECDCKFIFDVKTSFKAKKYSRAHQAITFESHSLWFTQVLTECTHIIYVAINHSGLIGYTRLTRCEKPGYVLLSYALHPDFIGKGLSKTMLQAYLEFFLYNCSRNSSESKAWAGEAQVILASVHADNVASIKCIEAAGFKRCDYQTYNDVTASVSPEPVSVETGWMYYSYEIQRF